jgi:hypothetical protein
VTSCHIELRGNLLAPQIAMTVLILRHIGAVYVVADTILHLVLSNFESVTATCEIFKLIPRLLHLLSLPLTYDKSLSLTSFLM